MVNQKVGKGVRAYIFFSLFFLLIFLFPFSYSYQECINNPEDSIYYAGSLQGATNLKPSVVIQWDRGVKVLNAKFCYNSQDTSQYLNCFLGDLEYIPSDTTDFTDTFIFTPTSFLAPSKDYVYIVLVKDRYSLCSYAYYNVSTSDVAQNIKLYQPPLGGVKSLPNNLTLNVSVPFTGICKYGFNGTLPDSCNNNPASSDCFKDIASMNKFTSNPHETYTLINKTNFYNSNNFDNKRDSTILVVCNNTGSYFYNIFRVAYYNSLPQLDWNIEPKTVTNSLNPTITLTLSSENFVYCNYSIKKKDSGEILLNGNANNANKSDQWTYFKEASNIINLERRGYVLPNGNYTFSLSCQDLAFNTFSSSKEFTISLQNAIKITSIKPGSSSWQNSTEVNVTVTTSISGKCNLTYGDDSYDLETTNNVLHWKTLTFEEGGNNITVFCHDIGGLNTRDSKKGVIKVDVSPPSSLEVSLQREVCDKTKIYVNINSHDELSGVEQFAFRLFNSTNDLLKNWSYYEYRGNKTYVLPIPSNLLEINKSYTLEIKTIDKAGNEAESKTLNFQVRDPSEIVCDFIPPILTYRIVNTSSGESILSLNCSDIGSGCQDYFFLSTHYLNLTNITNITVPECNYSDLTNNFLTYYFNENLTFNYPAFVCVFAQDLAMNNATLNVTIVPPLLNLMPPEEFCNNGQFDPNFGETDVDCGGPCEPCQLNQSCVINSDCSPGLECVQDVCIIPSCDDGFKDGDETDVDCGGSCEACQVNQSCSLDSDCISNLCYESICLGQDEDIDGDGLTNYEEVKEYFTDPYAYDSDGDGFSDGEEVRKGSDPLDAESIPKGNAFLWIFLFFVVILAVGAYFIYVSKFRKERKAKALGGRGVTHTKINLVQERKGKGLLSEIKSELEEKKKEELKKRKLVRLLREERKKKKESERKKLLEAFDVGKEDKIEGETSSKYKESVEESAGEKVEGNVGTKEETIVSYSSNVGIKEGTKAEDEDVFELLHKFVENPHKYSKEAKLEHKEFLAEKLGSEDFNKVESIMKKDRITLGDLKSVIGTSGQLDPTTLKVLVSLLLSSQKIGKDELKEFLEQLFNDSLISYRDYLEILDILEK